MSNTVVDPEELLLASWNGSTLTERRFKLAQPLQVTAVDRMVGKITIGDYTRDSNDLLSSWVISDLTGGHGIADHQAGVTDNRYRFGTIYTRYPSQWSKPYYITDSTIGSNAVYPMGDMYYSGTWYRFTVSNNTLYQNTTSRGAITGPPADKGIVFAGTATQPLFYVAQGSNGYSTFDPSTNTLTNNNTGGDIDAQSFLLWDDKLLAIDNGNAMYYATTAAATTTFTAYTLGGTTVRLPRQYEAKKLHAFYSGRTGDLVPYVVTDQNVWMFDPEVPAFKPVPDFESVHPRFGIASAVWRGELYVSAGMDVLAFNGDVIRNVGLSRDDGLPFRYQGWVRDMVSGQNALYALVVGATISSTTYYSVHEWSGFGWHCIYTGSVSSGTVSEMALSRAGDTYKLYWGHTVGGAIYNQQLPETFTNPRESLAEYEYANLILGDFTNEVNAGGFDYFNTTYYLETGFNDFGMRGYRKIANAVQINIPTAIGNSSETLTVKYRIDNTEAWTTLGTTNTPSYRNVFQFGTVHSDSGLYQGIGFEKIEFRIEIADYLQQPFIYSTSMSIDSIVFSFLKLMNPSESYNAVVDLTDTWHDYSPAEQLDFLEDQRTAAQFTFMKYQDTWKRVRVAQMTSIEASGQDTRSQVQLSIVEVPTTLGLPESS